MPNFSPYITGAISPNSTTLLVNSTEVSSFYLNGIFQGYKLLYRETDQSSYTNYREHVSYGNHTEFLISGLRPLTNYTIRVLAFTLSGDGFLSDSLFTALTMDGPGRYYHLHFTTRFRKLVEIIPVKNHTLVARKLILDVIYIMEE